MEGDYEELEEGDEGSGVGVLRCQLFECYCVAVFFVKVVREGREKGFFRTTDLQQPPKTKPRVVDQSHKRSKDMAGLESNWGEREREVNRRPGGETR